MVINIILLCLIGGISFYACRKIFFEKEEVIKSKFITQIFLQITFVISNLILSFVILQLLFSINDSDLKLWNFFQKIFSIFFYYILPNYLIYNLFDHTNMNGILKIIGFILLHLILSNILYNLFKGTYVVSFFDITFYTNHLKLLEYLAFIGDLFNGVSGAYTAVSNISSFLVYPLLIKKNLINPNQSDTKKKLEELNDKTFLQESKIKELIGENNSTNDSTLNTSSLSESQKSLQSELDSLI